MESYQEGSIIDVFDSIIEHLDKYKSGIVYMKMAWAHPEGNNDLIESKVDIDFICCDVNAIH